MKLKVKILKLAVRTLGAIAIFYVFLAICLPSKEIFTRPTLGVVALLSLVIALIKGAPHA